MKRTLLVLLGMVFCSIIIGQTTRKLKGTVFLERTSIFYPRMQFGELVKGDAEEMELNLYDEKKRLFYTCSIKGAATDVERNYYFYDDKGNLTKLFVVKSARNKQQYDYDYSEVQSYTHEYKFNSNGKPSSDDITFTKYNTDGKIISSSFYGKIRYSYANGKTIAKYYNADGMEINEDKDDNFGKTCSGVKNKKDEILWFTASTYNVKKDKQGNVISYSRKVKGAITDYVEHVKVSYKYDSYGNCIEWNKKSSEDLKLLGVGGNAGNHYTSMTKDLKYSVSDSEYKDEMETAQQWLLNKPYCPDELILPYCSKDVERFNTLYSNKQYGDVLSNWCDTCVYTRLETMNNLYVNSVTNIAEQYADSLKFSEAIDVLQKLKANENFEGYYDSNRLDNLIASYEKANLKLEYDKVTNLAEQYTDNLKFSEAIDVLQKLKANENFEDYYDSNRIDNLIASYEKANLKLEYSKFVGNIKSMIKEAKFSEAVELLKDKEKYSGVYDENLLRELGATASKGLYEQTFTKAEKLYSAGNYVECYEFVEAMKKTADSDENREAALKQKCKDAVRDIYAKRYAEANSLHTSGKHREAMDMLVIQKSHAKYVPEGLINDYSVLKKECWMAWLCDDATTRLEQSEIDKKAKEWQKVYDSLKVVDEKYRHCKSYEDVLKLRQKAEKKLGLTK